MRSVLLFLATFFSVSAMATSLIHPQVDQGAPQFSAFIDKTNLYVTILADTCNSYGADLQVDPLCKKDRLTRNSAPICSVQLRVMTTKMMCPSSKLVPKVVRIDLTETKVDLGDLYQLNIEYNGQQIEIRAK